MLRWGVAKREATRRGEVHWEEQRGRGEARHMGEWEENKVGGIVREIIYYNLLEGSY